ncbi:MAG: hypothetical protein JXP34_24895 [Planctomycetes bacterium]|nr:hypothetical protein [Planctomycetota bacterium]
MAVGRTKAPGGSFPRIVLFAAVAATAAVQAATTRTLINKGDIWKYFKGTENPSDPYDAWLTIDYDDDFWDEGPTGIGYGDDDDATTLSDMEDNYIMVFCRKTFQIEDPSLAKTLTLRIQYDDGFVAWVNGVEVARRGVGTADTPVYYNTAGTQDHEVNSVAESIVLPLALPELVEGKNVLCITAHNNSISSSDLSMIPILDLVSNDPPKFKRGDTDADCRITLGDAIQLLDHLFLQGKAPICPDAADADDSGELGLEDAVFLLECMFAEGPKPPPPGHRECGLDPTDDALEDCVKHCCGD